MPGQTLDHALPLKKAFVEVPAKQSKSSAISNTISENDTELPDIRLVCHECESNSTHRKCGDFRSNDRKK